MGILGAVVLALYGDRTQLYQDPNNYATGYAKLTPLGEAQELQLGSFLRSQYIAPSAPFHINGISEDLVNAHQIHVQADNGGEGSVIVNSAQALLQGLYPPTSKSKTELANGTIVTGPLGGYQYLGVESVEPDQNIQLEAWTLCPAFEEHVKEFYNSAAFKKKAEEAAPFLDDLKPFLYGRPNNFENMWNIFDFINVNYIHNETYAYRLPPSVLSQARAYANFHEHGIFTDGAPEGIGNVAGRSILPSIIAALERIANVRDPLLLKLEAISYKPFISLFNLTGIDERYPDVKGIPEYGAALAFELHNNEEGETYLRTKYKNGPTDSFRTLNLFEHKDDIALNEFVYRLDLHAIMDKKQWCQVCHQTTDRGCSTCTADAKPPVHAGIPTIGSGPEGSTCLFGTEYLQAYALFSLVFFMIFGLFRLFKARRNNAPRLRGYDALPIINEFYDVDPVDVKIRA